MAKFGLFTAAVQKPLQEVEGDYMQQDGAFVKIFKNSPDRQLLDKQVAAFHLDKNQMVREL